MRLGAGDGLEVVVHLRHLDAGDVLASFDFGHGMREEKRYVVVVKALDDVSHKTGRLLHYLYAGENLRAGERESPRHDEPDVARAEYHHAASRHDAVHVDETLDGARRIDARRSRSRRHQRPSRTLAATHGENHGARLVNLEPAAWRHRRDLRTAVRLRRDVQHHRAADNRDAERIRLVDKPLRVFGAGQLLLEAVEPEAVVDALLQNAARRVVTLDDKDVRRARLLRRAGSGESRRSRAHDKHIERVKSREL